MKKIYYWELYDSSLEISIERYCHNCSKTVSFKNSGKRRHNANGKDIYEYAIYKCEKGHTWNLLLRKYKSSNSTNKEIDTDSPEKPCIYDNLDLHEIKKQGIEEIEIILNEVTGKWRIDKLLSDRIQDMSRSRICELIKSKNILLDGNHAKQGSTLRRYQKITISVKEL